MLVSMAAVTSAMQDVRRRASQCGRMQRVQTSVGAHLQQRQVRIRPEAGHDRMAAAVLGKAVRPGTAPGGRIQCMRPAAVVVRVEPSPEDLVLQGRRSRQEEREGTSVRVAS